MAKQEGTTIERRQGGTPGRTKPMRIVTYNLIVVHAVSDGRCALFDTEANQLTPLGES
jgi:hypothetical protein